MDRDLPRRFSDALDRCGYDRKAGLGIAFSGGRDSTALLVVAREVVGRDGLLAIHVDHAVREESARDADHCAAMAGRLGIEYASHRLQAAETGELIRQHGTEGGLRQLRYEALATICAARNIGYLATGHHLDDGLETHLLAMVRGSGMTGLAGPRRQRNLDCPAIGQQLIHPQLIHPQLIHPQLIRPLLDEPRAALERYLDEHPEIHWVEDASNADLSNPRNRLRHQVIPIIKELAGSSAPIARSLELLQDDRRGLELLWRWRLEQLDIGLDGEMLDLSGLPSLSDPVLRPAIRTFVADRTGGHPPSRDAVTRIVEALAEPGRTRWLDIHGARLRVEDCRICIDRGPLTELAPLPVGVTSPTYSHELGVTIECKIGNTESSESALDNPLQVEFDLDKLGREAITTLTLRAARPGDRFSPFGLGGTVRLLRWLAKNGIGRSARRAVPVVSTCDGIIWVVGLRRGAQAPITDKTKARLRLSVSRQEPSEIRESSSTIVAPPGVAPPGVGPTGSSE